MTIHILRRQLRMVSLLENGIFIYTLRLRRAEHLCWQCCYSVFCVQSLVDLSWPTLGWRSTWATAYSASLQYSSAQQVHLFRNCIQRCMGMYPEVVVNLRRTRIESNVSGAWAELETETNCWAGSGFYLLTKNRCCQSFDKIVKHCRCEVCHIFTFIILTFNKSEAF